MRKQLNATARHKAILLSVAIFGALLAGLAFYQSELSKRISAQEQIELEAACDEVQHVFNTKVAVLDTSISDLALFLGSVKQIDPAVEKKLAANIVGGRKGLDAVAIVQDVPDADRQSFEKAYLSGRSILALNERGTSPSRRKARYCAIRNIVPESSNQAALGLDLLSEEKRRKALLEAGSNRRVIHSAPLRPVQDKPGATLCCLLICPVASEGQENPTLFVSAVLRIAEVAEETNRVLSQGRIVEVTDATRQRHPITMWHQKFPTGATIRHEKLDLGGRIVDLAIMPLGEGSTGTHGKMLELVVWVFGVVTCFLAAILVGSILFKRIEADEHRRELQLLATELLTEISQQEIHPPR